MIAEFIEVTILTHRPVMMKEVLELLNLKPGAVVLDATLGGGGHSKEMVKKILPGGRLIGLDADEAAIRIAEENLKEYRDSVTCINENFRNLDQVLLKENIQSVNAILMDVGISSYQMDDQSRGFSIKLNNRLDMRMDKRLATSAYDIINKYKEDNLSDIIKQFGEERFHNRIAKYIVEERSRKPIETTEELASVVYRAVGYRYKKSRIDPATRTFQAIRIVVNDELTALEEGLKKAVSWLDVGARICVISFHSLEDRIVKNIFRGYSRLGVVKIVTKKPLRPTQDEIVANPRSRSARLRVAERV